MIEMHDVSRKFDGKVAVSSLTLKIEPGSIFACVGPNGAGKTTTIRMLIGLLLPTTGTVSICGHDIVTDAVRAKRHIGYIPDQPFLYDKLTAREFMTFVGNIYLMDSGTVQRKIDEFAELFEMTSYLDELCESHSHGMKQRVVLSAALMHDPGILVVDEPMVGLDPAGARLVRGLFRERAENGATVFMSTHTLSLVESIASEVGVLHKGRLLFKGSVQEMREQVSDRKLEDAFFQMTLEGDHASA